MNSVNYAGRLVKDAEVRELKNAKKTKVKAFMTAPPFHYFTHTSNMPSLKSIFNLSSTNDFSPSSPST